MTVSEMLERISSKELTEWKAYYQIKSEMMKKEDKALEARMKTGKHRTATLGPSQ